MLPDDMVELIHAELDGRLPDEQRAELSRFLLENQEARRLRDELRQLHAALARVGSSAPPEGLREAVLSATARGPGGMGGRLNWRRAWTRNGVLRYAAAFAGGVMVSAIAFQFGAGRGASFDATDVTGTMAPSVAPKGSGSAAVVLPGGLGVAAARDSGSAFVLDYDLAAGRPVRIVTTVHAAGEASHPAAVLEVYADGVMLQRETLRPASTD